MMIYFTDVTEIVSYKVVAVLGFGDDARALTTPVCQYFGQGLTSTVNGKSFPQTYWSPGVSPVRTDTTMRRNPGGTRVEILRREGYLASPLYRSQNAAEIARQIWVEHNQDLITKVGLLDDSLFANEDLRQEALRVLNQPGQVDQSLDSSVIDGTRYLNMTRYMKPSEIESVKRELRECVVQDSRILGQLNETLRLNETRIDGANLGGAHGVQYVDSEIAYSGNELLNATAVHRQPPPPLSANIYQPFTDLKISTSSVKGAKKALKTDPKAVVRVEKKKASSQHKNGVLLKTKSGGRLKFDRIPFGPDQKQYVYVAKEIASKGKFSFPDDLCDLYSASIQGSEKIQFSGTLQKLVSIIVRSETAFFAGEIGKTNYKFIKYQPSVIHLKNDDPEIYYFLDWVRVFKSAAKGKLSPLGYRPKLYRCKSESGKRTFSELGISGGLCKEFKPTIDDSQGRNQGSAFSFNSVRSFPEGDGSPEFMAVPLHLLDTSSRSNLPVKARREVFGDTTASTRL